MKKTTLLLCCLIAYLVNVQTAKFESVKEISECRHYSESSVTDGSGNVYTTGRVYGSMYLDSTGKLILYGGSTRFPVMFIRKVSCSGVSIWAKKIGRPGIADPESIAIIKLGNLVMLQNSVIFVKLAGWKLTKILSKCLKS